MPDSKTKGGILNGRLVFIKEFLKHPLQIGSIIPSSRYLERRIVEAAGAASVDVIVELGPGTGGVTRAMLRAMPRHARLLSIEINPTFNKLVGKIKDHRLIELREIIAQYGLGPPNAIVSGIPFTTMSPSVGSQILESVSSVLPPNGRFVAYQVKNQVAILGRPFLGTGQISTEFLNIPPMRIFRWEKNA